jgi:hypothetical protein
LYINAFSPPGFGSTTLVFHFYPHFSFSLFNPDVFREIKITTAKGGFDFSESVGGSSINLQYETLIQLIEQLKVGNY